MSRPSALIFSAIWKQKVGRRPTANRMRKNSLLLRDLKSKRVDPLVASTRSLNVYLRLSRLHPRIFLSSMPLFSSSKYDASIDAKGVRKLLCEDWLRNQSDFRLIGASDCTKGAMPSHSRVRLLLIVGEVLCFRYMVSS